MISSIELSEFFIYHGVLGLFFSSFLAASILPFSSEVILVALLKLGGAPEELLISATLGNSLGSLVTYFIGRLGKLEWAQKFLGISDSQFLKYRSSSEKYGGFFGILCWLPIVGDPIALALGYFNASMKSFIITMTLGKFLRYAVIIYTFS